MTLDLKLTLLPRRLMELILTLFSCCWPPNHINCVFSESIWWHPLVNLRNTCIHPRYKGVHTTHPKEDVQLSIITIAVDSQEHFMLHHNDRDVCSIQQEKQGAQDAPLQHAWHDLGDCRFQILAEFFHKERRTAITSQNPVRPKEVSRRGSSMSWSTSDVILQVNYNFG